MAAEQKVIIYYKILASKIYSNLGSPNSFLMSTTKQTFLLRPFFAQVRLNFSEKVKIASYSIFCERRPGLGRHFPNYKRLEHQQPPPLAACAHYASSRLLLRESFHLIVCFIYGADPLHYYKSVPVAACLIVIGCLSTPNKTSTNFFPFVTSALISLCFVAASISFFTEKMS